MIATVHWPGGEWLRAMSVCLFLFAWLDAANAFETLGIEELHTNEDGSVQYIRLRERAGADNQCFLTGQQLASVRGNTVRIFTFPHNLPSRITAGRNVLIATRGFGDLRLVAPDYIVPAPFLFPEGGLLYFAGVDAIAYGPLPTDGLSSLGRSGLVISRNPINFRGESKFWGGALGQIILPC
jgi:hypothetical protein